MVGIEHSFAHGARAQEYTEMNNSPTGVYDAAMETGYVWSDVCLNFLNGVYTIQPVIQPIVSCKRIFYRLYNRLDVGLYMNQTHLIHTTQHPTVHPTEQSVSAITTGTTRCTTSWMYYANQPAI